MCWFWFQLGLTKDETHICFVYWTCNFEVGYRNYYSMQHQSKHGSLFWWHSLRMQKYKSMVCEVVLVLSGTLSTIHILVVSLWVMGYLLSCLRSILPFNNEGNYETQRIRDAVHSRQNAWRACHELILEM